MIRHHGTNLYLPLRPSLAAALSGRDRSGTWYAVKADHPNDAYHHVRNLVAGTGCQRHGPCRQCHAESLGVGLYHDALARAGHNANFAAALPADVRTPWAHPRARQVT